MAFFTYRKLINTTKIEDYLERKGYHIITGTALFKEFGYTSKNFSTINPNIKLNYQAYFRYKFAYLDKEEKEELTRLIGRVIEYIKQLNTTNYRYYTGYPNCTFYLATRDSKRDINSFTITEVFRKLINKIVENELQ